MDIGLLILRLTIGLTLAAHGIQKLFGWFGGPGIDAVGQLFASLGFQPGRRHALIASLAETGGGTLLALGLLTPLAAAVLCSVMLVAAVSVHVKKGFFVTSGGYEYTLVLGVAALTLAFTGQAPCLSTLCSGTASAAHSGVVSRFSLVFSAG